MNDFSFNYSPVNENYGLGVNGQIVTALRVQARMILAPFFQKVALSEIDSPDGTSYPVLTELAGQILTDVFKEGELGYESMEEACEIAVEFIKTLRPWEVHCLAFYFCTNDRFIENYEEQRNSEFYEETPEKDWDKVTGHYIAHSLMVLANNAEKLSNHLANELIHLQDIFSTEDISHWDASSIMYANENFEEYTGSNYKLIPLPLSDFDYWDRIMNPVEDDPNDEEEELDEYVESEVDEEDSIEVESSTQSTLSEREKDLESKVREYVYRQFRSHINGNSIRYGRAMFTVDMLVSGSIETYKLNPDKDIYYIVDYMFDYFCN